MALTELGVARGPGVEVREGYTDLVIAGLQAQAGATVRRAGERRASSAAIGNQRPCHAEGPCPGVPVVAPGATRVAPVVGSARSTFPTGGGHHAVVVDPPPDPPAGDGRSPAHRTGAQQPARRRGAADYIVRPFSATEPVARVQATLRRHGAPETFALSELPIDHAARPVTLAGTDVPSPAPSSICSASSRATPVESSPTGPSCTGSGDAGDPTTPPASAPS